MQNLILAITNPKELFENIAEDTQVVIPLITILVVLAITATLQQFAVDREALVDSQAPVLKQTYAAMGMSEAEINTTIETMRQGPSIAEISGALIGTPISIFILVLLWAVYFKIVAAIMNVGGSFGDWHAFIWWTRVPLVVGAIVALILNFIMNPGSAQELAVLSPLSWFEVPTYPGFDQALYQFDLISIWMIVVAGIGFSVWTEKPVGIGILIAAIPVVVFLVLFMVLNSLLLGTTISQ